MGRKLQYYGSEILRNVSGEVDISAGMDFLRDLVSDMKQILLMERGLGLAAPQAGENVRVFILNPAELDLNGHSVFINPEVRAHGPMQKDEEGCLSIPGIFELVRRPSMVSVRAADLEGAEFTLELSDYAARAVQHEKDHLDGVLFVDKLSPIRKKLVRKQLADIRREYGSDRGIF
ncbi:MAG: peptide deformylase [Candidatus Fermentibacteraceae bacterium]|nr:peptide deformylase [Candidatus Fermentibacteraceae bacterium]MBN2609123.1 peptide deformylase [Candidatus Fermentibacteraceae bacterium]